jgi:alpha-L-fucosidase 2
MNTQRESTDAYSLPNAKFATSYLGINKKIITTFISAMFIVQCSLAQSSTKLWYTKPAARFEEAFALGNGKTGATVLGGTKVDEIYLNDATFWSGGPLGPNDNPDVSYLVPQVRSALAKEDYKTAEKLNRKIEGKFSASYFPLGTLYIDQEYKESATDYYRELDISKAVANVRYSIGTVTYTREYFISHPDKLMLIKLSASKAGALNFNVKFKSLCKYTTSSKGSILQAHGYAPYHAYPDYMGPVSDPIRFDQNKGTRFTTNIRAKNKGGRVVLSDSCIQVTGATEVILYVSIATSFNGFDKNPVTNGANSKTLANIQLANGYKRPYNESMSRHVKDYQSFFNRVKLQLNGSTPPNKPTDERLQKYNEGVADYDLEQLYFQFGRYLLISCSRTPGVPANLQGIWNPYARPPWSCNYTMNINTQENYWLAEIANLSEMHMPFLTFLQNLEVTGKHTAKAYYGIDKGWAAGHNSDIWAMSNPAGDYGKVAPRSSAWNMGGTWAASHLWEHYLFTCDSVFLKEKGYPLMKGAAEFCLAWLTKDKNGKLITSPSTSPEAQYRLSDGFSGATLYGGTADLAIIKRCFKETIKASEILNVDKDFRSKIKTALNQMLPYQIGKNGNLQEWYHDWEDDEVQHRHQSHLYGIFPGDEITPEKTPALVEAAKKTLNIKGDRATGWSTGWRINLWARLKDGNRAYKIFKVLLTYVQPAGADNVIYDGGGGTYPNLFDAHPPFQIDGNFGGAAGIIEMLMQSSDDDGITLLPALPDAWQTGTISGICARGGFEIALKWKEGALESVNILSKNGNKCRVKYRNKSISFDTKKGEHYIVDANLSYRNQ